MKHLLCLFAFLCLLSHAAADDRITDADHILKPLVGTVVVAEGVAWGEGDKGLGERLTLPNGQTIYLSGIEFSTKDLNGCLVRIVGKLSIEHMDAAPPMSQGYSTSFDYYQITVSECGVIPRVTLGFPKRQK